MILKKQIKKRDQAWNKRWKAPYGRGKWQSVGSLTALQKWQLRYAGAFSLQPNNDIRRVEYPWAFHCTDIKPGMNILEIGGGLSGFQFVLDKVGAHVTNIDPGMDAMGKGWKCDQESIQKLNAAFSCKVQLVSKSLPDAEIKAESQDRIFSISVLEHLVKSDLIATMDAAYNALKPGGSFIITTDLFLDTHPFTTRPSNKYGANIDIYELVTTTPLELTIGNKSELFGFPEFDHLKVQANLSEWFLGSGYPALAQAFVLTKPSSQHAAHISRQR